MATDVPEGVWGPTLKGGNNGRLRRYLLVTAAVLGGLVVVVAGIGLALFRIAEGNLDRVELPALTQRDRNLPLNFLVVGSDSREGLTEEQIRRYHLGRFSGQRGDTVILVSIAPGNEHVSVVSFPRDLLVVDDGERKKLTETFAEGPDHVVDVLQATTGVPINHYVEVSIPGFISVVEAVGTVRICLDEPLEDDKSGADFDAGCHEMSPVEALAFVRSRQTARGDFDRIDRQQQFMRALIDRVVDLGLLVDLPKLFNVVDEVTKNITTDARLGVGTMRTLAEELRGIAQGGVPMVTVPSYPTSIDGVSYVVTYDPAAEAVYEKLRRGEPLPALGTKEEHAEVDVAVWHAGNISEAERAQRALFWSAFPVSPAGHGPIEDVTRNAVIAAPGKEVEAGWVAMITGAVVTEPPPGVELPSGADVVLVVAPRPEPDLGVDRTVPEQRDDDPVFEEPSFAPPPEEPSEPVTTETTSPSPEPTTSPSPSPSESPTESETGILPTTPAPQDPDGDEDGAGDPPPEPTSSPSPDGGGDPA